MNFHLGIKSDPIEYRYSHKWLFDLLAELEIKYVQLGSFFELYTLEERFFRDLREEAEKRGLRIKSCFTTHRELGGFFTGDPYLEKAARKNYEIYIHAASLLGADYVGSNPGTVYRDRMEYKERGIECYLDNMKELMHIAFDSGLKGLTIEPMSSSAEPPSFPEEIVGMLETLKQYHLAHRDRTVPVYLCGDISHGIADRDKKILHDNISLFKTGIPFMAEFHFKNTDSLFNSTFGFSEEERRRGIVDAAEVVDIVYGTEKQWPVEEVIGYYETGGPKMGRDYSDIHLGEQLAESLGYLKKIIEEKREKR